MLSRDAGIDKPPMRFTYSRTNAKLANKGKRVITENVEGMLRNAV